MAHHEVPLVHQPRKAIQYGFSIDLLGAVIEKVTSQWFGESGRECVEYKDKESSRLQMRYLVLASRLTALNGTNAFRPILQVCR
ncbi:hypothetical protein [Bradyrhizobium sp. CB3481]|uniref:hypothetical protein n=1 Tax=Bradyrhizobium sp. CB3481 TaxID=3039158 RepID=UPI0024B0AB8C|nr:hypothetical protein [Bradyrhizobium sp. CB3481]WFU14928.1 hypothetical protein QA643_28645 [Bradyrhizobium sp. CB3481]